MHGFHQSIILLTKAFLFFTWCAVLVPPQALIMAVHRGRFSYLFPQLWHKGTCALFGLTVIVDGTPVTDRQTLFIANHVSYLDIPVMGSILQASFIAKKEVAGWPVFGFLSKLQQTAFISRSRADAQKEKNALSNMLDEGKSLILFPEGTSTDGRDVAPFKSSLFSMTLDDGRHDLVVQPFTLRIEQVDQRNPADQTVRDVFAWYGDMTMPPHLRGFTLSKGAVLRLVFHPPVNPRDYEDRKALADACWKAVHSGLTPAPVVTNLAA